MLFLKVLKDSTRKLLDLINAFSKLAGQKINVQKLVVLFSHKERNYVNRKKMGGTGDHHVK
jgi:hypothetical protein